MISMTIRKYALLGLAVGAALSVFALAVAPKATLAAGQANNPCAAPGVELKTNTRLDKIASAKMSLRKGSRCRFRAGICMGICKRGRFCNMVSFTRCSCSKIIVAPPR